MEFGTPGISLENRIRTPEGGQRTYILKLPHNYTLVVLTTPSTYQSHPVPLIINRIWCSRSLIDWLTGLEKAPKLSKIYC